MQCTALQHPVIAPARARTHAVRVVAFRDSTSSRLQRAGSQAQQAVGKAGSKVQQAGSRARQAVGGAAARGQKAVGRQGPQRGTSSGTSRGTSEEKKPLFWPLGKPPTTPRENAESVVTFVMIAGFFLTGVLFVTIPAFQVGGNAFTKTWQKGVNKSAGIKEPRTFDQGYAPGPGPAAAPESPAAKM